MIAENVSALAAKLGTTPEVITKFLTDANASEEVKPFATTLGALEVFTPEQLTQRLGNERRTAAEEAERTTKGNTYGAMDKRILADTGIARKDGESTIDYMARAAKEKYGTKSNESDEITRLRGEIEAKDGLLKQANQKLTDLEVSHATERKQGQINADLDAAIKALPINAEDKFLSGQRVLVKTLLGQQYDIDVVDGKVQFTDKGTKQVKRDAKTGDPMTAEALVIEFAPLVVSLKKTPSANTPSGYNKSGDNGNGGGSYDFGQYGSKEEFISDMRKRGVAKDSDQELKLYKEFKAARPDLNK